MAEVYVLRHAPKDNETGELTVEGRERATQLKGAFPDFNLVIASPASRTQETARLLTGKEPTIDTRAGHFMGTPEQSDLLNKAAKLHPLGFIGALFDAPEVKEDVTKKAQELVDLIHEASQKVAPDGKALIVTHDITLVPAKQLLSNLPVGTPVETFEPLSGYTVDDKGEVKLFNP
jgi:broad specificity phosphatase PhoE